MQTYFYCTEDNFGQSTGYVKSLKLTEDQIEYDFHIKERANKYFRGIFLYETESEATRAALN